MSVPRASEPADVSPETSESLRALEAALDYAFTDRSLLLSALTHRSFAAIVRQGSKRRASRRRAGEECDDNQRLEFLGDAVIDLVATEALYSAMPTANEGRLTQHRSALVNEARMAAAARALSLGDYLRVAPGVEHEALRVKASVLADTFEAIAGAMFLDGGLDVVRRLFARLYASELAEPRPHVTAKATIQEITQSRWKLTPVYTSAATDDGGFTAEVSVGEHVRARGTGRSKREAEEHAARAALDLLEAEPSSDASAQNL